MKYKAYEDRVIYQIYPRSFKDSNGDGIGDLPGIISKLDYLKDLGIGIIWLSPIYKSPLDDMGYDVADYYSIHSDYGTMDDFDKLIIEASKRDIKIVMDLVVNHTSDEHKWFVEALKDPQSPYRDYYYFKRGKGKDFRLPPNNWDSVFTGTAWEELKNEPGMFYLHLYGVKQPDLNYHNPKVIKEVENIIEFWLNKGVYGFRCDVIDQIYKTTLEDGKFRFFNKGVEHYICQPGNHEVLKTLRKNVFDKREDSMFMGENAFMTIDQGKAFFDHELDMFISFDHMNIDKRSIPVFKKKFKVKKLRDALFMWQTSVPWNALYLENHDQLRSINRFGDLKHYYKESGKVLALLLLTLRGTPLIYNGEEIGMLNYNEIKFEDINDVAILSCYKIGKKYHVPFNFLMKHLYNINRDNARSPIQWNKDINAGFSTGKPWLKTNVNYASGINVQSELAEQDSILNFYKRMLKYRNNSDILKHGEFIPLELNKNVIYFERQLDGKSLFVVVNLSKKSIKTQELIGKKCIISNIPLTNEKVISPYFAGIFEI
ncbi:MAG: alpha-glucosidase [Bacilli bacterium]